MSRPAPGSSSPGAMTHLATAEADDRSFMEQQLARFEEWVAPLRERHPDLLVHGENSAALLGAGAARFDMARCGGAVYGLDPFGVDPARFGLEAACELRSWVAACKPCAPGESAGYGRTFVATTATELAVIPIGYGDGVRRVLSNNADVLIGGRRRPLVGTVSMDNLTATRRRRRRRRRAGDPARRGRRRAHQRRGDRRPPGHDQLRDHLRDQPAGAAPLPPRRRMTRRAGARARGAWREPRLARRRRRPRRAARAPAGDRPRPRRRRPDRAAGPRARARRARARRSRSRTSSAPGASSPATTPGRSTSPRCAAATSRPTFACATSPSTRSRARWTAAS